MPLRVDDEQSVNMDKLTQLQDCIEQLLLIMKLSVVQLVQRSDFKRVSDAIPITKSRPKEKVDPPAKFEENKRELIVDLVRKAKQIELLIDSLPLPEPEGSQALRLEALEAELQKQNAEYKVAVERASLYIPLKVGLAVDRPFTGLLHRDITRAFRELTDISAGLDP
ncbi:hypothetical protein FRB91_001676 [Serendipita sp. 411]|nr:hypothetical protein FRB91_001676 [Serendipita sp. 411]